MAKTPGVGLHAEAGAVGGSPATESRLMPEAAKRAVEEIVAACGGVSRGWRGEFLGFDIGGKEETAVLSPGGICSMGAVGRDGIYVKLDAGEVVVWEGDGLKNAVAFRLSEDVSKACTALRILASGCEGGNADECRERKVKQLKEELGLKEVRYKVKKEWGFVELGGRRRYRRRR